MIKDTLLSRHQCLEILSKQSGNFLRQEMDIVFQKNNVLDKDRNLIMEIVYGVNKRILTLDHIVKHYSRQLPKNAYVLNALRVGLYQMLFLQKIPDYAAVSTVVELVKKYRSAKIANYVNAILRNVQRSIRLDSIQQAENFLPISSEFGYTFEQKIFPTTSDIEQHYSVIYSYPIDLVKKWLQNFGRQGCQQLLLAGNERPPVSLRIRNKDCLASLQSINKDNFILFPEHNLAIIKNANRISQIFGYQQGHWAVAGITPIKTIEFMNPQPNTNILDMCAAPGSKSIHIHDKCQGDCFVIACDISYERLEKILSSMQRCQIKNVFPLVIDSCNLPAKFTNFFDQVLLDAPCSNTGVFSKRPEARWRYSQNQLQSLQQQQLSLLESASKVIKLGGEIIYSTCSIELEENQMLVEKFVSQHKEFCIIDSHQQLPLPPFFDGGTCYKLLKRSS